jgi:hypothetical protein
LDRLDRAGQVGSSIVCDLAEKTHGHVQLLDGHEAELVPEVARQALV